MISPIGGSGVRPIGGRGRVAPQSETRALIAVTPIGESDAITPATTRAAPFRTQAAFLTQLIATHARLPQTRLKARATPADASASYRASQRQATPVSGQRLLRSS